MVVTRHLGRKGGILLGAILLALAITGATLAYGYLSNTTTLALVTSAGGDFASITPETGQPIWKVWGQYKGTIGSGNLFKVDTYTTNFTGDFAVTVSIANGDQLVKVYRVLSLFLQAWSQNGSQVDVNSDGVVDTQDSVLLTLNNAEANFYINQYSGSDNYTITVANGYYVSNIQPSGSALPWPTWAHQPVLYASVLQR